MNEDQLVARNATQPRETNIHSFSGIRTCDPSDRMQPLNLTSTRRGTTAFTNTNVTGLVSLFKSYLITVNNTSKDTQNYEYNFVCCFIWVWNLVAAVEGGTYAEGLWEWDVEQKHLDLRGTR
jgi:hypothetical protein